MKTKIARDLLGVLAALTFTLQPAAQAAPGNPDTAAAVQQALAYFHTTQQPGGYWNYSGYEPAATGAAVFAMLSQKDQWGVNATQYQADVDRAIAYLLARASTTTVSTRNDGTNISPGGSGSCPGYWWAGANGEDTYTTGLITPAIALYAAGHANEVATTSGPLAGQTWVQIAQGVINMFAASQSTSLNGNRLPVASGRYRPCGGQVADGGRHPRHGGGPALRVPGRRNRARDASLQAPTSRGSQRAAW